MVGADSGERGPNLSMFSLRTIFNSKSKCLVVNHTALQFMVVLQDINKFGVISIASPESKKTHWGMNREKEQSIKKRGGCWSKVCGEEFVS